MIEIKERSDYRSKWKYTGAWHQPLTPTFNLTCPICGGEARFKEYYPHSHNHGGGVNCRVDQWFKCCSCAYVWVHGITVNETIYREIEGRLKDRVGNIRPLHILESIELQKEDL